MPRKYDSYYDDVPRPSAKLFGLGMTWVIFIGAFVFVAGIILSVGAFAFDWFQAGQEIVSPDNVREQYRFAYDYINDMEAGAQQACTYEQAVEESKADGASSSIVEQRRSQLLAVEQNYARIKADYDARMDDLFRAKIVAPSDVPKEAPTLQEMQQQLGICQ